MNIIPQHLYLIAYYLVTYKLCMTCLSSIVHSSSALTVLVVQEAVSSDSPVLGIAVDDNNITLPAEVFANKNGSGIAT